MARTLKPKHTELVVRWYARTGSTRKTAKHLRCSRGTVLRHLRAAGVDMRPAGRPRVCTTCGYQCAPPVCTKCCTPTSSST